MNKFKKGIVKIARYLPISSEYIGSPKGYYASSKQYWEAYSTHESKSKRKINYQLFSDSSISYKAPPKSIHKQIHWKFEEKLVHTHPETFVISAPDCRVIGSKGTVITHDDKLLFDVSLQFRIVRNIKNIELHDAFKYIKPPKCKRIPETVAVLSTAGAGGYFHWLTDALPRLNLIQELFPGGLESIDKFLVNKGIPAIKESLTMVNLPLEKIILTNSSTHVRAETLVIPSLPGITGYPPFWACSFLREKLVACKVNVNPISRLYISRSKARYRRITNEESVVNCLSKFGFTSLNLENYDLETQIALLSHADVIVAPHGAGLTNLVWCKSGAKVLEIFSPNYVNPCFWAIAEQIKLEYFYLIGEGDAPPEYFDPRQSAEDISVSIDKLEMSLSMLLY